MKKISLFLCLGFICNPANAFDTKAEQAIVMDYNTGTILFEKNANDPVAPASMSKLMTTYMVLEKLKDGTLSLDDEFVVSENAWRKGGAATGSSTMFLEPNKRVKVSDLLRGIIIQSGNDACIVVAENMYGTEGAFAEEMNKTAKEIGLTDSYFLNSTGWPDEGHVMSVKDIAVLSKKIIEEFPEYYSIFSEKNFTYNKIKQGNRNPLLYSMPGMADGLKTGHTKASGYGVAASVLTSNGKRRVILVVNGLDSMKDRETESAQLMNKAINTYDNYTAFKKGQVVTTLPVFLGKEDVVPVTIDADLVLTLPRFKRSDVKFDVVFENPERAPIKAGEKLGTLRVDIPDMDDIQVPVYALKDIKKKGYFGRLSQWFDTIF